MTPKERAAMQQALEALERWKEWDERTQQEMHDDIDDAAITALREALAEQAEEPVAWMYKYYTETRLAVDKNTSGMHVTDSIPLYATPVRTKDLTDDEIRFWIGRFPFLLNEESEKWVIGLARVVIAADREKNK